MNKNSGFTLIEILISVIILVVVVTSVSLVYRGAYISSEKAATYVRLSSSMPGVLATVREKIRNSQFSNTSLSNTGMNGEVEYVWNASVVSSKNVKSSVLDGERVGLGFGNAYNLWDVSLTLSYKGISNTYQYREVSWRDR
ncbi:prepilin-type N-terminal cleavage/methylation domain-containing protein [Pseudoalteromonas sp. MMG013]|uniref:prepilin-type N-terminal cleavage/methylation domain-containing protein n=1 Tax=Pseudoalteromonas sp. MMG013 TaxID=2822687 RepID=UPI001B37F926|nr:prepilin-type N-terminal cleavage/methylation domain-containing protein [Pseudoalteromonas sp. MMG013]MBQ4860832.1 prepilin-type N-terminal cleavage/methylation domain-containing protein [Pseudoalteromonas sp. MMG013]